MKSPLLILMLSFLIAYNVLGQETIEKKPWSLETNLLSWTFGHVGPEFRLRVPSDKRNLTYLFSFRYAYDIRFPHEPAFIAGDLTTYSTSFRGGHTLGAGYSVPIIGHRLTFQQQLNIGQFRYQHQQTVCTESVSGTNSSESILCSCIQVENNTFNRNVNVGMMTLELMSELPINKRISLGASLALHFNLAYSTLSNFKLHGLCYPNIFVNQARQDISWGGRERL